VTLKDAAHPALPETPNAAPPAREIELKLLFAAEDLPKLRGAIAAIAGTKPVTKTLVTTYFDTHARALLAKRAALRVRQSGADYVQTLKTEGELTFGMRSRGEWEMPVKALAPEPSLFLAEEARGLLANIDVTTLSPLFTTAFKRQTWHIERNASLIEVALDQGTLTAGERERPIDELELELKRGHAADLMRLAEMLAEEFPLRLGYQSKAAAGYALATGDPPPHKTAPSFTLDPGMTTETAWIAIVDHCLGHFLDNAACAMDGRSADGVHQCRVAIRRLRSAFSVFGKSLPSAQTGWLRAEAKWLAGALGPARDLDVFLADTLAPVEKAFGEEPAFATLRLRLEEARARAYGDVRHVLCSTRVTRFFLRLNVWLSTRGWRAAASAKALRRLDAPIVDLAQAKLDRRLKAVRKAGRGFADLSIEERHVVRIAMKKLRYAGEFFRSLYEKEVTKPFLKDLAAIQQHLGRLNDLAVADALLSRHGADATEAMGRVRGLILGWHGHAAQANERDLRAAWDEFRAAAPFWRDAR
jgi:inorganic triphosphatase YgiF